MRKLSYRLSLAAGAALLAFGGASALAVSDHANAHAQGKGKGNAVVTVDPSASPTASPTHGKGSLASGPLKSCQKKETAVNNIMVRTVDRATKQIAVFDKIATRTEDFATTKGKQPANLSTLTGAVDAAKLKATTDLSSLTTTATFKCDGTDPKGAAGVFKSNLKIVTADLKAYKTAVKNLIVGVAQANGVDSGSDDTDSPKPSPTGSLLPTPSPTVTPSPTASALPSVSPSPSTEVKP
jgi:hypothetical protein